MAVQCDYQGPRFAGRNVPLNEKRELIVMVMEIGLGVCVAAIDVRCSSSRKMGDFSHGYTAVHNCNSYNV